MKTRITTLQNKIREQCIDGLLVTQLENIRYLCGFTGSTGWLIVSLANSWLCVDSRFTEHAEHETGSSGTEVLQVTGDISKWLIQTASTKGICTLGFEADNVTYSMYQSIRESASDNKIKLLPVKDIVESQRAIKDPVEIETITKAAGLVDMIYEHAVSIIKPGITETAVSWEMEKFAREHGSDTIPFDFIVASGPNSSMPHARPTDRVISTSEPIMIDIGARAGGYCSDFTRTLCLGKVDETFRKIYDIVLAAQLNAIASISDGMSGKEADATGRVIIENAGYGRYFAHGLGHGIGLMIHESPRLGPSSTDIIADGMVFTIEPGIYIPGWGGVRIEDTVIMEKGKVKSLTKTNKLLDI